MDPNTGALIEADEETLKEYEERLGRELVRVGPEEIGVVRGMTVSERKAYAKRLAKRRAQAKAAKTQRRRQRRR